MDEKASALTNPMEMCVTRTTARDVFDLQTRVCASRGHVDELKEEVEVSAMQRPNASRVRPDV